MVLVATLAKQQALMKAKSEQDICVMANNLTSRTPYVLARFIKNKMQFSYFEKSYGFNFD